MGTRAWPVLVAAVLAVGASGCRQPVATKPPAKPAHPGPATLPALRESLYFLQGDGTLSPGALDKLKTWVGAWGRLGTWTLTVPSGPGLSFELMERRILAIRTEMRRLGVPRVETILGPPEPPGPYDVIYVAKGPP